MLLINKCFCVLWVKETITINMLFNILYKRLFRCLK